MSKYDPAEIVERLKKGGKISRSEVSFVRDSLRNPLPSDDLYDLMRALGLGVKPNPDDIALVEKYFYTETDDWNLQGSIYALCDYWGLTKTYLDRLLFFVNLKNWKDYPSAAIVSFGALGDYLFQSKDAYVFGRLLDLYDRDMALYRERAPEYDEQHLASVYRALDLGVRGRAALVDHVKTKMPDNISDDVISKAREQAMKLRKH